MRFCCRFETPSEIPANYLSGNFSELYAPVLQRETTHENSIFELASPSVRLTDCLQFPLCENGAIVRNLNYRPWQWVYSISGCKSCPGCF
jgi:hypothetical protein